MDAFDELVPMGRMFDSHVTPTDHLYFFSHERRPRATITSPASGYLVSVQRFPRDQSPHWDPSIVAPDHRVIVAHSCNLYSIFIHLGELAPEIASRVGPIEPGRSWYGSRSAPVFVEGGAALATIGGSSFDYSLHDTSVVLQGFAIPGHYAGEPWKIHTVDPFDYLPEELRAELASKTARSVPPLGGKIDYDVPGTLAGNWFLDGTVDYGGNVPPGTREYWKGHLAIAYDHVDPSQIRVSIGGDTGLDTSKCRSCFGVYGVRGNAPDPVKVDAASGLVRYDLVARKGGSEKWREATVNDDAVQLGAFLAQVVDATTIRVEVVPGTRVADLQGFSSNARLYRR